MKDRKKLVLIGTYRPENRDWITGKLLYNLPMEDGSQLEQYEVFSKLILFAGDNIPLAFTINNVTIADRNALRHLGYTMSSNPNGKCYALFDLGRRLSPEMVLCDSSSELFVATSRWSGMIDNAFYDKPLPACEGQSTRNLFLKLKPYLVRKSAKTIPYQQSDFMNMLSNNEKVPFPGPSKQDAKFTFIDLFAGIGGFRLAMQSCGGRCVFSSEWNKDAQKTYCANYGETPLGDITKRSTKDAIPDGFDVLCAGFPCQAFSVAGYRKGFEDTRGTLFFDVAQILSEKRPVAFFLENVKNLKTHDNGKTYATIHRVLTEDLGYVVFDAIMSPDDYANLPQNRERIFIVGFDPKRISGEIIKSFSFPKPVPCKRTIADCLEKDVSDPQFFYDERYGCYSELKRCMKRDDTVYQWRRQYVRENKSNRCPTLTANMGGGGHNVPFVLDNGRIRKLTPRECLNFQGFPQGYRFPEIALSRRYMQAGNSVAVPLIKRVAEQLVKVIKKGGV